MIEEIKEAILKELPEARVFVSDPNNDGLHLQAVVISDTFENLSLVAQHRKVMLALQTHFSTTLHALKLKTYTCSSWEKHKLSQLQTP